MPILNNKFILNHLKGSGWQFIVALLIIFSYSLLINITLNEQSMIDFASFYSASFTLIEGGNPYQGLFTTYLAKAQPVTTNLNPPIVLWLFHPLARLSYHTAAIIWSIGSFILGLVGVFFAFYHATSSNFMKENWFILYVGYFLLYATIINTAIIQFGSVLLFFIMLGYHFYLKNRHYLSGIFWGSIIAIKLFPALLFFYALKQKRFKVVIVMMASFLFISFIPFLIYGPIIYKQYLEMLPRVYWYGDNWNASLYGFFFRIFTLFSQGNYHEHSIKLISYLIIFMTSMLWYLKELKANKLDTHQPFCLTLAMMLLISPLGWLYYFSILIFPLTFTWINAPSNSFMFLWILCLFFLNFPIDYVHLDSHVHWVDRIGFLSFYFYGLVLLIYLLKQQEKIPDKPKGTMAENNYSFLPAMLIIFLFSFLEVIVNFTTRLVQTH